VPAPTSSAATSTPAPTSTETPFFLASGDRPVYAVFHDARRSRPGAPGIVVCSSIGLEQLTSYRNEVLAARALADQGFPVLRYHPRGHGDSAGDFADVTVTSLIADARAAGAWLRERAGADRIAWLGVRFGALAAAGAVMAESGAALALWEPVQRPLEYFRAWLRGILFSSVSHGERPAATVDEMLANVERDGMLDVHGYHFHRALLASARELSLESVLAGWSGPALLVQMQQRRSVAPAHEAFAAALRQRGAAVTIAQVNEEPGWHFLQNPAVESPSLVQATVEWFDAVA
jgi:pimeloyl-ACP methyl ester carboxylesterase